MSNEIMPLVSIIVPIYNTQEFLPRCLDSILNQSYVNMEIILVNDGSTDDSVSVCEKFAAKNSRIRIISQSNQGIIAAKKTGIKICHGKYVMFVDSDDWIEPQLLEVMVQAIMECACSLVCTNVSMDYENYTVEKRNGIPSGTYETSKIVKDLFYYKDMDYYGILPYSVAKLYPRELLKEVLDNINNEIRYAEDKAIVFSFVYRNIKICITNNMYYHYCVRNGSACQSENQDYLVELTAFYKFVKKLFDGHEEQAHLLQQLGKYMLQEAKHAVENKLGLSSPGKPICVDSYQLDPSVFLKKKRKVILYGAGTVGSDYRKQLTDCINIELCGWVDKDYGKYQKKGLDVQSVGYIQKTRYDYIIVSVRKQATFREIREELIDMGIEDNVIVWGRPYGAPYENN